MKKLNKKKVPKDINQLAAYIVQESIKEAKADSDKVDATKNKN